MPSSRATFTAGLLSVAAVIGALGPGAPTGVAAIDLVERALLGALVGFLATRGGSGGWLWFVAIAAVFSTGAARGLAFVALVALVVAMFTHRDEPFVGPVTVVGSLPALQALGPADPRGASAVLAALAVLGLVVSAVRRLPSRRRRRVLRWSALPAGLILLVVIAGLVGLVLAGRQQDRALDRAETGLEEVRRGEMESAARTFDRAAASFDDAAATLPVPLRVVTTPVPVLHQHIEAAHRTASEGGDLLSEASGTAAEADLEAVRIDRGQVDLAQVTRLEAPLEELVDAVDEMESVVDEVDTTWLASGVVDRVTHFDDVLARARDDTDVALEAVRQVPTILGGDGPRTYLVAFTTPAEARGVGGLMGSWAELRATDGRIELVETGRTADLARLPGADDRVLEASDEYVARYGSFHPERLVQDVTLSPDFPSVAEVLASVYRQATGTEVDGVLLLDPFALEALVGIVGGVDVPDLGLRLTEENTADFLLRDQYVTFDERPDRVDALAQVADATMEALLAGADLPAPPDLVDAVQVPVAEDRLLVWFADPTEQEFVTRIGVDGGVPRAGGEDYVGVVVQNAGNSKIDSFLHRTVEQAVQLDPESGTVDTDLRIELENRAPERGWPDYVIGSAPERNLPRGTSRVLLSVYTPLELESASIDGEAVAFQRQEEFGGLVHSAYLDIPSRSTAVVELALTGAVDLEDGYRLRWESQPLVHEPRWLLSVSGPEPLRPSDGPTRRLAEVGEPVRVREDVTLAFELGSGD